MKLKEFIEEYKGFDFDSKEVAIVDQRTGKIMLGKLSESRFKISENYQHMLERDVYDWTHSENTMLILL